MLFLVLALVEKFLCRSPSSSQAGRWSYWRVRGTEYGISLDRSTKVADKASAAKLLRFTGWCFRSILRFGHLTALADRSGDPRKLSAASVRFLCAMRGAWRLGRGRRWRRRFRVAWR
jgi:hypothetical protein